MSRTDWASIIELICGLSTRGGRRLFLWKLLRVLSLFWLVHQHLQYANRVLYIQGIANF